MIDQERRSRKSHPGNPLHLSRIGVMSEAFQENPVFDHSRQARRFSAVGLWRQTPHHEVPAEATIAVADSVAKIEKQQKLWQELHFSNKVLIQPKLLLKGKMLVRH